MMLGFLLLFFGALLSLILICAIVFALLQRARVDDMEARLRRLEHMLGAQAQAPVAPPEPSPAPPKPVVPVAPAPAPPVPLPATDRSRFEQAVGGIWLQNVGSVLLLVGVFFLLIWGYSSGHLGPEGLVAGGVALGLVFVWRGDRTARSLPPFGYALIGLGVGIAYVTIYAGHFQLGVFAPGIALLLLALVSVATILLGLRYRVQTIAAIGVAGAYVPPLLGAWTPSAGFPLTAAQLLGYLAATNLLVYGLSARAGWTRLNLAAVLLATFVWIVVVGQSSWSWPIEIGLALLFAVLGLAPIVALARSQAPLKASDLAVVAVAPFCFVALSWAFAAGADRLAVGALAIALFAVYAAAAFWVETERRERDLWRPLTGAATLFLTLALQRLLGDRNTPIAWCAEGLLLLSFGIGIESAWLRACGYGVMGLGTLWLYGSYLANLSHLPTAFPIFNFYGLRDLVCILTLFAAARLLARHRSSLTNMERYFSEIATVVANLLLALWSIRETDHLARVLSGLPVGALPTSAEVTPQVQALSTALAILALIAQAGFLLRRGIASGRFYLRGLAYGLAIMATAILLIPLGSGPTGWKEGMVPIVYPAGLVRLLVLGALVWIAGRLAANRSRLDAAERRVPEAWTAVVCGLWLAWTASEAGHVASAVVGGMDLADPEVTARRTGILTSAFTSAGWLVEAVILMVLGWYRYSAFLRWSGLALFGITVLKFLLYDLRTVDLFWRFLTAVLVGAALLGVSYAYQRRQRATTRQAEPAAR